MAVPIYIPTNSAHTILFFTALLTFFVFLLTVILTGMKQHSHFISLMISDAEYLFIHYRQILYPLSHQGSKPPYNSTSKNKTHIQSDLKMDEDFENFPYKTYKWSTDV